MIQLFLINLIAFADPEIASENLSKGMVLVPAGQYLPLYRSTDQQASWVPAFKLDRYPVTNAEFLEFVKASGNWRKSAVPALFADEHYLSHWANDLEPNPEGIDQLQSPVTHISWFAAKAYCASKGKRLPTVAEWERAAQIGFSQFDGHNEAGFYDKLLAWYGKPTPQVLPAVGLSKSNVLGIYDMHGLVWEWTQDFQSALVTGESRGDSAIERTLFCGGGAVGASDFKNYAAFMRFAYRSSLQANYAVASLGCRCAEGVEDEN